MSYMRIAIVVLLFSFWRERGLFLLVWMESKTSANGADGKRDSHTDKRNNLSAGLSLNDPMYSVSTMISKSLKDPAVPSLHSPNTTDPGSLPADRATDPSSSKYYLRTPRCYYIKLRVIRISS